MVSGTRGKQPLIIAIIAGVPIATLGAWLWAGVGYTKDIERHTSEIGEIKTEFKKVTDINQQQEVTISQLRVMFETTKDDIREIKDTLKSQWRKDNARPENK